MWTWRTGVQTLLLILLATGVGVWGALLFEPKPAPLPPALVSTAEPSADTTALARWLGGSAHLRITVTGLMRSDQQGAALLAISGAPARAYRRGETLAPGITLAEVQANGVVLNRDGIPERLPATPPTAPAQGLHQTSPPARRPH